MVKTLNPSLYLVLGPENCQQKSIFDVVGQAIEGGVTLVQYRNKISDFGSQVDDVKQLLKLTKARNIPLLVNDNIAVALAAGADGVHLGQSDTPVIEARKSLGDNAIIGLTVKNQSHVEKAPIDLLDYLGIGGIFPTSSKINPDAPIGLEGLKEMLAYIAKRGHIQTTAIAGLDESNCEDVVGCGVDGVAIVSSICASSNPRESAKRLRRKIESALSERQKQ